MVTKLSSTDAIYSIINLIKDTIIFVLKILLLWRLWRSFNNEIMNPTPRELRISILAYFQLTIIWSIALIIQDVLLIWIFFSKSTANISILESVNYVVIDIYYVAGYGANAVLIYFLKVKLIDTFKNTFLSVKPLLNTIMLSIAILVLFCAAFTVIMIPSIDHWYPSVDNVYITPDRLEWGMLFVVFAVIVSIYLVVVLISFNKGLYQFISLTKKNDRNLSLEINNKLLHGITKQTNLITIGVLTSFMWMGTSILASQMIATIYSRLIVVVLFTLLQGLNPSCAYLSFPFNDDQYELVCKYSHKFCICICKTIIDDKNDNSVTSLLLSDDMANNVDAIQMFEHYYICDGSNNCEIVERICLMLIEHNNGHIQQYEDEQHHLKEILDDFNHLLQYHDNNECLKHIFDKMEDENHNDRVECIMYQRNHRRRLVIDTHFEEHANYGLLRIMDKIHSFFCHKYGESKSVRDTHDMSRNVSKFNSNFDIDNDANIYSFGQRFEYKEEKNDWSVHPIYHSFKEELLNNEVSHIENTIYMIEYEKCRQYMETNYVKKLQDRNADIQLSFSYILSLLIYCNCDEYQNKWSSTFRRIPTNEDDESLKKRHAYFYYSSLYLRNLVEYFGELLIDINNKDKRFYHGVSQILYFVRTIAKFNGPLSTSEEPKVALNFSNNTGIILELQYSFSTYPLKSKYFKCSFFSDYVNERECLFIGGIPIMIITNIINASNGLQYGKYINALNIINSILNGTYKPNNNKYNDDETALDLCIDLMQHQLTGSINNETHPNLPKYVEILLDKYCTNLDNILIFWHHLENIKGFKDVFGAQNNLLFFDLSLILNLFPNIEQIEYYNTSFTHHLHIRYIAQYNHDKANCLQFIVIHHTTSSSKLYLDEHGSDWQFMKEKNKIILLNKNFENDRKLTVKFNKINQGSASTNLLSNLF